VTRTLGDQLGLCPWTGQAYAFPGYAHAGFDFRTDRNPLDEPAKYLIQESVPPMAAVVTNVLPQQTGADAESW
jgi:hypothetical protein